jgi:hypothetical protein
MEPLTEEKAFAGEESCQEDLDEVSHNEDPDQTLVSISPLKEYEVVYHFE